jgi:hypothetical protein
MYSDQDIANLVARVQQLEGQAMVRQNTNVPNIKLLSPNFLTRAFAVWGHMFVASLLISLAVSCLFVILGAIVGASLGNVINDLLRNIGAGF